MRRRRRWPAARLPRWGRSRAACSGGRVRDAARGQGAGWRWSASCPRCVATTSNTTPLQIQNLACDQRELLWLEVGNGRRDPASSDAVLAAGDHAAILRSPHAGSPAVAAEGPDLVAVDLDLDEAGGREQLGQPVGVEQSVVGVPDPAGDAPLVGAAVGGALGVAAEETAVGAQGP